jgi:hypothetical protein
MAPSLIRQALAIYQRRQKPSFLRRRRGRNLPLSIRQGLLLVFGIGIFVALVFILIYYIWYVPMEKSTQQDSRAQSPHPQALARLRLSPILYRGKSCRSPPRARDYTYDSRGSVNRQRIFAPA